MFRRNQIELTSSVDSNVLYILQPLDHLELLFMIKIVDGGETHHQTHRQKDRKAFNPTPFYPLNQDSQTERDHSSCCQQSNELVFKIF